MATEVFYFKGKCNWAKVQAPDKEYDYFGMDFYPDDVKAFEATGTQLKPNKDDNGETFFKVKRRPTAMIKGELVEFGGPVVLNKDNEKTDELIGNGSEVTIKVSIYDGAKGKGTRLESVRIENLVAYEGGAKVVGELPEHPF